MVFDAVHDARFWIITTHDACDSIRARMESILNRTDPAPIPPFR